MSKFSRCPTCGREASGGMFGGVYIPLNKCRDKGHVFCNECKNGDRCPVCMSGNISWDCDKAFMKK